METLQPIKQNDMVANNNNYKVSKNKYTTNEVDLLLKFLSLKWFFSSRSYLSHLILTIVIHIKQMLVRI